MNDNIPFSVFNAIKFATADIISSMHGASHHSSMVDYRFKKNIESFLMGMVAPHYANVKAKWVDSSADEKWVSAADMNIIDGKRLQEAFDVVFKSLAPDDRKILEGMNYSKFNGQPMAKLQKDNKVLFYAYMGSGEAAPINDAGLPPKGFPPADPVIAPPPVEPVKKDGEPENKQELMQPGVVKQNPMDKEFDGVSNAPKI